jgi:hypothetical protein
MKIAPDKSVKHAARFVVLMLSFLFVVPKARAQTTVAATDTTAARQTIISLMDSSANQWNNGNLEAFMDIYDPTATMMMPSGPVNLRAIDALYRKKYFLNGKPIQNLRYAEMVVSFLGSGYALLTGEFVLYGNGIAERTGRFSLVMILTKKGWKIYHDHSG